MKGPQTCCRKSCHEASQTRQVFGLRFWKTLRRPSSASAMPPPTQSAENEKRCMTAVEVEYSTRLETLALAQLLAKSSIISNDPNDRPRS